MESGYCRICFTNRDDLTEISEETKENFHFLTNIQLTNSEIYSNSICQDCKVKLQSTTEYVRQLAENENHLSNKSSFNDPLQHEYHKILSYYPAIKTEKVEYKAVRNQASNHSKHKINAQKRTYQQMSTGSTSNFMESDESDNEDIGNDVALSPLNEDQANSLSIDMIDSINDLEDVKNVFKLMLYEIQGSKTPKIKPSNSKLLKVTPLQRPSTFDNSIDDKNIKLTKITNIYEFEDFIRKISRNEAYKQELIDSWKKMANNTRQTEVNGKAYNILNELFEREFLVSSVRWGQPFEKDKIRDDHLYLKLQDEFTDIILSVYELERSKDSIEHIARIFKNVFNNKVRRQEKKMQ